MPPKKKEAPKKGDEDGPNPEEELKVLQMRNNTLQLQIRERTEVISEAHSAKRAIEADVDTMTRQYNSSQGSTNKMTHEMTKQFEGMQELLVDKITLLSRTVGDLKEELASGEVTLERKAQEKDAVLELRDKEIVALKAKMEDMATEFAGMLNGTLEKMRERIELSSTNNFDASAGVQLGQRKM
mmetsp:Transcript_31487/g.62855  ORF Transcript_31487/g.62855 Transcript_31487/m.62855 type:complete len:184 (-) Transcript_31487:184-735(-)